MHLVFFGQDGFLDAFTLSTPVTIAVLAGAALGWLNSIAWIFGYRRRRALKAMLKART